MQLMKPQSKTIIFFLTFMLTALQSQADEIRCEQALSLKPDSDVLEVLEQRTMLSYDAQVFQDSVITATIEGHTVVVDEFIFGERPEPKNIFQRIKNRFNQYKKHIVSANQYTIELENSGAISLSLVPGLKGVFAIGDMSGTVKLLSHRLKDPKLRRDANGNLMAYSESDPDAYVTYTPEDSDDLGIENEERVKSGVFQSLKMDEVLRDRLASLTEAWEERERFGVSSDLRKIIAALYVDKNGVAWARFHNSVYKKVDLLD